MPEKTVEHLFLFGSGAHLKLTWVVALSQWGMLILHYELWQCCSRCEFDLNTSSERDGLFTEDFRNYDFSEPTDHQCPQNRIDLTNGPHKYPCPTES